MPTDSLTRPLDIKRVPKEPIILTFDPLESSDEDVVAIFADKIARSIWLMIKPGHLTNQHFNVWCLKIAAFLRAKMPRTVEDLYYVVSVFRLERGGGFFSADIEENREFLDRLLDAVTGRRQIEYVVKE